MPVTLRHATERIRTAGKEGRGAVISGLQTKSSEVSQLVNAVKSTPSLKVLKFIECFSEEDQCIAIFKAASQLPQLQKLSLNACFVTDRVAVLMAATLKDSKAFPKLQFLSLYGNAIGDAGAVALAKAIAGRFVLTELNVGENCIGERGGAALALMLETNITMTSMYTFDNAIPSALEDEMVGILNKRRLLMEAHGGSAALEHQAGDGNGNSIDERNDTIDIDQVTKSARIASTAARRGPISWRDLPWVVPLLFSLFWSVAVRNDLFMGYLDGPMSGQMVSIVLGATAIIISSLLFFSLAPINPRTQLTALAIIAQLVFVVSHQHFLASGAAIAGLGTVFFVIFVRTGVTLYWRHFTKDKSITLKKEQ